MKTVTLYILPEEGADYGSLEENIDFLEQQVPFEPEILDIADEYDIRVIDSEEFFARFRGSRDNAATRVVKIKIPSTQKSKFISALLKECVTSRDLIFKSLKQAGLVKINV